MTNVLDWTNTLPNEIGYWWYWDGDKATNPLLHQVYKRAIGFGVFSNSIYGTEDISIEKMEGWWLKAIQPLAPNPLPNWIEQHRPKYEKMNCGDLIREAARMHGELLYRQKKYDQLLDATSPERLDKLAKEIVEDWWKISTWGDKAEKIHRVTTKLKTVFWCE